jgi:hypothetical protein
VVLDDASEEEPEELFPNSGDKAPPSNRESKKEREEKLKKMMEDDDADGMDPCVRARTLYRIYPLTSFQMKKCLMPMRSPSESPHRRSNHPHLHPSPLS